MYIIRKVAGPFRGSRAGRGLTEAAAAAAPVDNNQSGRRPSVTQRGGGVGVQTSKPVRRPSPLPCPDASVLRPILSSWQCLNISLGSTSLMETSVTLYVYKFSPILPWRMDVG